MRLNIFYKEYYISFAFGFTNVRNTKTSQLIIFYILFKP